MSSQVSQSPSGMPHAVEEIEGPLSQAGNGRGETKC